MGQLCKLNFKICVGLLGNYIEPLAHKIVLQGGDKILGHKHHAAQGLADDAVQGDEDGEGNEGPEAAGHGIDALFPVELLHLGVELLGVALVAALQLLDFGLEPGGAHHALLALGHKGGENKVDRQSEENNGHTIAAGQLIELDHEPGKGFSDCCPHR